MCISFVRQLCFGIALGFISQMVAQAQTPAAGSITIIKAGRLMDGRGGEPISPAMVRIEGEKIAEVGRNLNVPANAKVIDLGEATLLPGLIDLHTHLTNRMGCIGKMA